MDEARRSKTLAFSLDGRKYASLMASQRDGWTNLLKRGVVSALGVLLGSYLIDGISYDSKGTLVLAVVLLGFLTAFLRPLLILLTLPFVVLTLGIGILLINAGLYMIVGHLLEGFTVATYWDAFWGALCVTLCNFVFKRWIEGGGSSGRGVNPGVFVRRSSGSSSRPKKAKDDVIDI